MSQWAEVRHLHVVEGVPKKEIARRLKLDVKTVRRAIGRSMPPVRVSPPRPGTLDPWRERIKQWLCEEPRLTAKRIRRLLLPMAGPVPARTVRRYVAGLRTAVRLKEAFVHRSVRPGTTMEVDFGESWVDIAGTPCKVNYLVATLPFSNAYFAKAYPVERIESLLDGIESAFRYFWGLVDRLVLDNTSLADGEVGCARSGAVLEPVAVPAADIFVVLETTPEPQPIALPSTTLPRTRGGELCSPRGNLPNPSQTARVLAGYRRTAGERGRGQARPFGAADLAAVLATCQRPRRRVRGVESDEVAVERGRLDAVIAGLLFMAGMRRSEVSALRWADVAAAAAATGCW